ncbi:MAG: SGNH/GDSL hydrolase family protein [Verrucomicrobia bacterium]|nr:SGNH/GDSL hydrolase family protein [Verrucomicrobiota bacterium]MDA1086029.1 SGNH/GDSL hydrolase family protein [Verrucomicrobiota bacterium]
MVHQYAENLDLVYELKPSAESRDKPYKINRFGMRDQEYALQKPANTIRIAVIGDSVAFGHQIPVEDTFEHLLEDKLNATSDVHFEVLNFSVVGYNSRQEEIVLKDKVLPFEPDYLLIGVCLNDETQSDGLGELARQMHPKAWGSRLHSRLVSTMLNRWERSSARRRKDFTQINHLFATAKQLGERQGFEPIVLNFPYHFTSLEEYKPKWRAQQETIETYARDNGVASIDFMLLWKDHDAVTRQNFYLKDDRKHFSREGMQQIADVLYERFSGSRED